LLRAAGREVGYVVDGGVRAVFDELGAEIVEKFKL
jgi:hypothetical protein